MKCILVMCVFFTLSTHLHNYAGGDVPSQSPLNEQEIKRIIQEAIEPTTAEALWRWKCWIVGGIACVTVGTLLIKRARRLDRRINQELQNTENLREEVSKGLHGINQVLTEQKVVIVDLELQAETLNTSIGTQLSQIESDLTGIEKIQNEITETLSEETTNYKQNVIKRITDTNGAVGTEGKSLIENIKNLNKNDDAVHSAIENSLNKNVIDFNTQFEVTEKKVAQKTKEMGSNLSSIEASKNLIAQEIASVITNMQIATQGMEASSEPDDTESRIKGLTHQVKKLAKNIEHRGRLMKTKLPSSLGGRYRSASPVARQQHFNARLVKGPSVNSNETDYSRRSSIGNFDDCNNNNNNINFRSSKEDNNNNNNFRSSKDENLN